MPPLPTALPPETVGIRTVVEAETVEGSETALLRETVASVAALKPVTMPLLRSVVMALVGSVVATSPLLVKDSADLVPAVLIVTDARRVRRSLLPPLLVPGLMTPLTGGRNKRRVMLCTMRIYYY